MTLQFPINPSINQQFTASNNLIYRYDGQKWITLGTAAVEGGYVLKSGDNMSGDLTLGTDKITLNATDGSITAAGAIKSEKHLWANASGNYIGIYNYQNTSSNPKSYTQQDSANAETISFGWDGSITATDAVAVVSSTSATTFSNVNANGLVCQNPVSSSSDIFFRGRTSSGDNKVSIYTDGSAAFKSDVTVGNPATFPNTGVKLFEDGQVYIRSTTTAGLQIRNTTNAAEVPIALNTDGSAVFAGNLTAPNITSTFESVENIKSVLYRLKAAVLIPDGTVDELRLRILEALENISLDTSDEEESN